MGAGLETTARMNRVVVLGAVTPVESMMIGIAQIESSTMRTIWRPMRNPVFWARRNSIRLRTTATTIPAVIANTDATSAPSAGRARTRIGLVINPAAMAASAVSGYKQAIASQRQKNINKLKMMLARIAPSPPPPPGMGEAEE